MTDSAQLGSLYLAHHGWLQGWLRRRLGCRDQAADLAQDTFLRLLTGRLPPLLDEPRAYLTKVAHGVLCNHYRRLSLERAWAEALASLPEAWAPSPEERQLALATLHALDAMLDRLPERVRSAFLMSQLEGMSYADIAAALGVAERSIKRYMAQAFEACLLFEAEAA